MAAGPLRHLGVDVIVKIPPIGEAAPSWDELSAQVRDLNALEADGVVVSDHLFISHGKERAAGPKPPDPLILLAVIGALSPRLSLGTMVLNLSFVDPILAFRGYSQLANLFGGDRVVAGVGAGWNPEEFHAAGRKMPSFSDRMIRFEESLQLARALFDTGVADIHGRFVQTQHLPLTPGSAQPPRLLLGGGSDRLLDLAARYADVLDINGSSKQPALRGSHPVHIDAMRKLLTSVDDLEASIARIRAGEVAAGRAAGSVDLSISFTLIKIGSRAGVDGWKARQCRQAGVDPAAADTSAYMLAGSASEVASALTERIERLGLRRITLDSTATYRRFCDTVFPLM